MQQLPDVQDVQVVLRSEGTGEWVAWAPQWPSVRHRGTSCEAADSAVRRQLLELRLAQRVAEDSRPG